MAQIRLLCLLASSCLSSSSLRSAKRARVTPMNGEVPAESVAGLLSHHDGAEQARSRSMKKPLASLAERAPVRRPNIQIAGFPFTHAD